MNSLKICFRNIVVLGLVFLVLLGLCGTLSVQSYYGYACPVAAKRIPELNAERDRIDQGYNPWGRGDPISREEKDRMIEVIDARIEGFKRDNDIYTQNMRDDARAKETAERAQKIEEAREYWNNYNREWNEAAASYLNSSDVDRADYRTQLSSAQEAELDRFVEQRKQQSAQAASSQGSGPPDGNPSTDFIRDSIEQLSELGSDLFNNIMEALGAGETASEVARTGETTGYDPFDIREDGSSVSGSGQTEGTEQTEGTGSVTIPITGDGGSDQTPGSGQTGGTGQPGGTDQTSGNGGCDGSGPDCDGGESGTQEFDFSDYLISPDY